MNSGKDLQQRIQSFGKAVLADIDPNASASAEGKYLTDYTTTWKTLRVPQLKKILREAGLKVSGNKTSLTQRLVENQIDPKEHGIDIVQPRATPVMVAVDTSATTLLVCPPSVLSNWQLQAGTHFEEGCVRLLTYHGSGRNQDPSFLQSFDIVLTTYGVVLSDFKHYESGKSTNKRVLEKGLFVLNWRRVVLDEGASSMTRSPWPYDVLLIFGVSYRSLYSKSED